MWSISRVSCLLALWLCAACAPEPEAAPSYLVGVWSISRVSCLLALWLCAACAPEPEAAPSYLVGVWETAAEGYTDQHMFIDEHRIGFGTSAVTADGYVITQIDESREGTKTLFVVSYQGEDQTKYQLAFFYEPAAGGRIIYKNQDHLVWTRKVATT